MFLVNQKYFMHLTSLDFSQRTSGFCSENFRTPDAESSAKVFTGSLPLIILAKKLRVLMFDGVSASTIRRF